MTGAPPPARADEASALSRRQDQGAIPVQLVARTRATSPAVGPAEREPARTGFAKCAR